MTHRLFFWKITLCLIVAQLSYAIPREMRKKGFVPLHKVDSTILTSLRYLTHDNFVGKPVDGYKKPVVIMTRQAAQALKAVQADLKEDGLCLVVYDAYRPQEAVDHFGKWGKDNGDKLKKDHYYPFIEKDKVFDLGYVAKRSGHSRGSTIDLTIIKDGQALHEIREEKRTLRDGRTITFLDDGTVDMGTSFDLFDEASHTHNQLIEPIFQERRNYLKAVMERHGFVNYENEWWHFTLKDEPFPAHNDESYFNFPIE